MNAPVTKSQTFRNVIYSSLMRGATLVCQLASTTVVARNLSAADVGVVGFANVIIGFLAHFGDCGVLNASIRRPQMQRSNLETAFTLKVVLGAGAFGATMLFAPFAWHFCDHPAAANVMRFLALNFFVGTIGFLPLVQLTREMNYRALVIPGVINAVVRATLAITLVKCGWKFWAVAMADVGANLAGGIAMQCVRKIPLGFRLDKEDVREFLGFGLPLLGTGVLAFLSFNLANLMISSAMGIAQLGYYTLAFNWGTFVYGLLTDTVNNVLFPTFAAIQHDREKMRRWYLKTVDLVAFLAVVINTALMANAYAFLEIFLGKGSDKWLPAAPTLQILCLYGVLCAVTAPIGNCLMARGQTRTLLRAVVLSGGVQLPLLLVVLPFHKIEWVAFVMIGSYVTQAFVYVPALRREFGISLTDLVKQMWPVVPAVAAGWGATHLLFPTTEGTMFTLAGRGLFTVTVTALVHGICTKFRCFQEAWELTFRKFANNISGANAAKNA